MVWVGRLLSAVVITAALVMSGVLAASADSDDDCGGASTYIGCPQTGGSSDGSGVTVIGTIDRDHNGSGPGSTGGSGPGHTLTDEELLTLLDDLCVGDGHCAARDGAALNPLIPQGDPSTPAGADPGRTITITDLARFLPATAALHTEPDGWAVVGVPANFWTDVSAITVDGSLLGETAQVRFTPRAYRFDYGDGSARTTATAGSSWAALGQEELTATPTSHVYRERATRQARVTVVYSAEYRFADGPWITVAGAVSGTTPPQRMLVVVERTALTTPG